MKHGESSVIIWDIISFKSTDSMIFLHRRINSRDCLQILSGQVHLMAQALFPEGNTIFQDENAQIHTARIV